MKWAIFSDIHSNHLAFQRVWEDAQRKGVRGYIFLGDFVGYFSGVHEVLSRVRRLRRPHFWVRGNHDKAVTGLEDPRYFNILALQALLWTKEQLTKGEKRWLLSLPQGPLVVKEDIWICHGSPLDEDEYILSDYDAWRVFMNFSAKVVFFGHSHLPCFFTFNGEVLDGGWIQRYPFTLPLEQSKRYLINPGAVGQPRDRDPRACYGVWDDEANTVTLYRLAYPVEAMVTHGAEEGLPPSLLHRLKGGY